MTGKNILEAKKKLMYLKKQRSNIQFKAISNFTCGIIVSIIVIAMANVAGLDYVGEIIKFSAVVLALVSASCHFFTISRFYKKKEIELKSKLYELE